MPTLSHYPIPYRTKGETTSELDGFLKKKKKRELSNSESHVELKVILLIWAEKMET